MVELPKPLKFWLNINRLFLIRATKEVFEIRDDLLDLRGAKLVLALQALMDHG